MARTHVNLDDEALKEMDDQVGQHGRSRFLGTAGEGEAQRIGLEGAIRKGVGMLKDEDYPHWRETGSVHASGGGDLTVDDLPAR